ncbi:biotin transporter BioY [Sporosarcina sp. JAI121]|uniref:biotin transporter BioY n=1 Tax=Sporosarcina sp. JAI121 TaxID=2723064 RepID=UPI0015C7E965|nr:biotin transporter BioY [Sporosarcina sp. JAI121]NYF24879.1 biotin transport system substrate-specific component [Sporosarcina sp. JAI121]
MTESSYKLRMMIISALFAAIIGVFAQVTIPLPLVPITGQTLAIGLAATILGARYGILSVLLYLFMGAIGIPVFAQMSGGLGSLFGPTGGFLFGFLPTAFTIGYFLEKAGFTLKNAIIANVIGMFVALSFGTAWLKFFANLTWTAAFAGGFAPFILVGLIKATLAAWAGITVRNRLKSTILLTAWSAQVK